MLITKKSNRNRNQKLNRNQNLILPIQLQRNNSSNIQKIPQRKRKTILSLLLIIFIDQQQKEKEINKRKRKNETFYSHTRGNCSLRPCRFQSLSINSYEAPLLPSDFVDQLMYFLRLIHHSLTTFLSFSYEPCPVFPQCHFCTNL